MGLNRENCIHRGFGQYIYVFILISLNSLIQGQSLCPIEYSNGRNEGTITSTSYSIRQASRSFTTDWEIDQSVASTSLEGLKRSSTLVLDNLNLDIPEGAKITNIRLKVSGHSVGAGHVMDSEVSIGQPYNKGENKAGKGYSKASVWSRNKGSRSWRYGLVADTWSRDWTTEEINHPTFGIWISVRNIMTSQIEVFFEDVELEVSYIELPTFCDGSCPTFSINRDLEYDYYQWHLPNGFSFTSKDDKHHIIDLHAHDTLTSGIYSLCVDAFENGNVEDQCCQDFRYVICRPGSIGDFIWHDVNNNGIQDQGEPGIANVKIDLFDIQNKLITSVRTNSSGLYQFTNVERGRYYLKVNIEGEYEEAKSNIGDDAFDSDLTNNNGFATTDLFLVDYGQDKTDIDIGLLPLAEASGFVWIDTNGDGIRNQSEMGVSGLNVYLTTQFLDTIATTVTQSDGQFEFGGISVGVYYFSIEADTSFVATLKDVGQDDTDSDINEDFISDVFFLPPGGLNNLGGGLVEAIEVSGQVWLDEDCSGTVENSEPLIEGVIVYLLDQQLNKLDSTLTNNLGVYNFDNLLPTEYSLEVQNTGRIYSATTLGLNSNLNDDDGRLHTDPFITMSGTSLMDFDLGVVQYRSSICGTTWFDLDYDGIFGANDLILPDVKVYLMDTGLTYLDSIITDQEGNYCFEGLVPGFHIVRFVKEEFQVFSPGLQGNVDNGSDVISEEGLSSIIQIKSGKNIIDIDAGIANKPVVGDFVWQDDNNNGLQDPGELGVANVKLYLNDGQGIVDSTMTDIDGYYQFSFFTPGMYYISANIPDGFGPVLNNGGAVDLNSDFTNSNGEGTSDVINFTPNNIIDDLDFGIKENLGSICGLFWQDANANGLQDIVEMSGIRNIDLVAKDANGIVVSSTSTDSEGRYCLDNIPAGLVIVEVVDLPVFYQFTELGVGGDPTIDNDFDLLGESMPIMVIPNAVEENIDGGLTLKSNIGDFIWLDENNNGLQDSDESGIAGIKVSIFDDQDVFIKSTTSDVSGFYMIPNIEPGEYYLVFDSIDNRTFTTMNVSVNEGSDPDATGRTTNFEVFPNIDYFDFDAGYILPKSSISGLTWMDENENGIREIDEALYGGRDLILFDESMNFLASAVTNDMGQYNFAGLDAGIYYVVFRDKANQPFTLPNVGMDETIDSDVTNSQDQGSTDLIILGIGENRLNVDAGFLPKMSSIKGMTWLDLNANGINDDEDKVINDAKIYISSVGGSFIDSIAVDENGAYAFIGLDSGSYIINIEVDTSCFIPTPKNQGSDILMDSDININFYSDTIDLELDTILCGIDGGFIGYSTLSGMSFKDINENGIREAGEKGFDGIAVCLRRMDGTLIAKDTTKSINGVKGQYEFNRIIPNEYYIHFTRPLFYAVSPMDIGGDDTVDSDVALINAFQANSDTLVFNSKDTIASLDFGLFFRQEMQSMVAGEVWNDTEVDGLQDAAEELLEGVEVRLYTEGGTLLETLTTALDGSYAFRELAEGFYYVESTLRVGEAATTYGVGADESINCDFQLRDGVARTPTFYLGTVSDTMEVDLGVAPAITIGDRVWADNNFNGLQDPDEGGVEGVFINLMDQAGDLIETVTTDANGMYLFGPYAIGEYQLEVLTPQEMSTTKTNAGDPMFDSDFDRNGRTGIIDLSTPGNIDTLDVGLVQNGSIGNRIFIDFNGNGMQNDNEPGMSDYLVQLFSADGQLINSQLTQGDMTLGMGGFYTFNDVRPGDYYIVFAIEDDYVFTDPDMSVEAMDSDVTSSITFGSTDIFTINPGQNNQDIDAGILLPSTIGDFVWEDKNGDGIQVGDELGIPNVEVRLLRSTGQTIATTTSDENGFYSFTGLRQGLYSVRFPKLEEFDITIRDNAPDDMTDSDADPVTGITSLISLAHGAVFLGVDCGYVSTNFANESNQGTQNSIGNNNPQTIESIKVEVINPIPNPAVFETLLKAEDGYYTLIVYNRSGKIADKRRVEAVNGRIRLDISDYKAGKYFFQLRNPSRAYDGHLIRVF